MDTIPVKALDCLKENLKEPEIVKDSAKYKCPQCHKCLLNFDALGLHLKKYHKVKELWRCSYCRFKCLYQGDMYLHAYRDHYCAGCDKLMDVICRECH